MEETIDIIIQNIYNHPVLPPLKIKPNILRKLLLACTTQVPFFDHVGNIWVQTDGVSMGSVLGPLFSDFYMAHLESKILNHKIKKPKLYLRYVDDILIATKDINEIQELQQTFQNNLVLKFKYELNTDNKIPFLDVLIDSNNDKITTSPYVKPTSLNSCLLNYKSECPYRYKKAVIKNLLNRAQLISSTRPIFYNELKLIKQKLVNNGYPNHIIDEQIKFTLKNIDKTDKSIQNKDNYIHLFYSNQMHPNFEKDEKAVQKIIRRYVSTTEKNKHLKLTIYYKKHKTENLLITNNASPKTTFLQKANVVYQFKCPLGDCSSNENLYIGYTTTRLSRRLTLHLNDNSSIANHLKQTHNCPHSNIRKLLNENTSILTHTNNSKKLKILEAIFIKTRQPKINKIKFEYSANILQCL